MLIKRFKKLPANFKKRQIVAPIPVWHFSKSYEPYKKGAQALVESRCGKRYSPYDRNPNWPNCKDCEAASPTTGFPYGKNIYISYKELPKPALPKFIEQSILPYKE